MWRQVLPPTIRSLWSFFFKYLTVNLFSLASLAIGYAACILIGLYVLDESNFDRFIPEAEKVYVLSASYGPKGQPLVDSDITPAGMAPWMRQSLPELKDVTRLNPIDWSVRSSKTNRYDHLFWADANLFEILELPFVAGNPHTALSKPNTIVMTQRMARRYFDRDDVIGQKVVLNEAMTVTITGVLRDFPANTNLGRELFVSGTSGNSMLTVFDTRPDFQWPSTYMYLRLHDASPAAAEAKLLPILIQHWNSQFNQPERLRLIPLLSQHFEPVADGEMKPRGHRDTVIAMICVAVLILTLAVVNFTGLMIARIDERGYEMAIRKALGAKKGDLVVQILSEATLISLMGLWAGLAIVERFLPYVNLRLKLGLDLWSHPPAIMVFGTLVAILIGIVGGLYPALALSSLRPLQGLRLSATAQVASQTSMLGRQIWLVLQFALAISLLICAHTVYRQWTYANVKALNFNGENVVIVSDVSTTAGGLAFRRDAQKLNGVLATSFSRWAPLEKDIRPAWAKSHDGSLVKFTRHSVDDQFFALYSVPLLAGRNFSGVDMNPTYPQEVIVNRTATIKLGFAQPVDAIGRKISYAADRLHLDSTIIGVVDDMRFSTVRAPMRPMLFDNHVDVASVLSIKMRPEQQTETLAEIDRLWKQDKPRNGTIDRQYFAAYLAAQYSDMYQQRQIFIFFSLVGLCLSGLCLISLSIFFARSRKREIAIRRALGADFWTIFKLRIAPFVQPLLLSNAIAWPLASILMLRWLSSFSDHVTLIPTSFIGATGLVAFVALVITGSYGIGVSRDRLAPALRHE